MEELEELFVGMIQENIPAITQKLKKELLKDLCGFCYEIVIKKITNKEMISKDELIEIVINRLEDKE